MFSSSCSAFGFSHTTEMSQLQTSQSDFTTQLQKEMSQLQTSQRKCHKCRQAKAKCHNCRQANRISPYNYKTCKSRSCIKISCVLHFWIRTLESIVQESNGLYSLRVMLQHNGSFHDVLLVDRANVYASILKRNSPHTSMNYRVQPRCQYLHN